MSGVFHFLRRGLFAIRRLFARSQTVDGFTPDADPTAPAWCARCNSRIAEDTAMEADVSEGISELVCLSCYVNAETPNV